MPVLVSMDGCVAQYSAADRGGRQVEGSGQCTPCSTYGTEGRRTSIWRVGAGNVGATKMAWTHVVSCERALG